MRELTLLLRKKLPSIASIGLGERVDKLPRTFAEKLLGRQPRQRKTHILSIHVSGSDFGDLKPTIDAWCDQNNARVEWVVLPQLTTGKRR